MDFTQKLIGQLVELIPLNETDFEPLFKIASDPKIWEQHPSPDRYKKEAFQTYFDAAIASKMAYLILDTQEKKVIGCTRFYNFRPEEKSIAIGYTFLSTSYWGRKFNSEVKLLMIDFAFSFLDEIYFHVGEHNIRSQKAVERLGVINLGLIDFPGIDVKHFEYVLRKNEL